VNRVRIFDLGCCDCFLAFDAARFVSAKFETWRVLRFQWHAHGVYISISNARAFFEQKCSRETAIFNAKRTRPAPGAFAIRAVLRSAAVSLNFFLSAGPQNHKVSAAANPSIPRGPNSHRYCIVARVSAEKGYRYGKVGREPPRASGLPPRVRQGRNAAFKHSTSFLTVLQLKVAA
jgi:hypothetical protein